MGGLVSWWSTGSSWKVQRQSGSAHPRHPPQPVQHFTGTPHISNPRRQGPRYPTDSRCLISNSTKAFDNQPRRAVGTHVETGPGMHDRRIQLRIELLSRRCGLPLQLRFHIGDRLPSSPRFGRRRPFAQPRVSQALNGQPGQAHSHPSSPRVQPTPSSSPTSHKDIGLPFPLRLVLFRCGRCVDRFRRGRSFRPRPGESSSASDSRPNPRASSITSSTTRPGQTRAPAHTHRFVEQASATPNTRNPPARSPYRDPQAPCQLRQSSQRRQTSQDDDIDRTTPDEARASGPVRPRFSIASRAPAAARRRPGRLPRCLRPEPPPIFTVASPLTTCQAGLTIYFHHPGRPGPPAPRRRSHRPVQPATPSLPPTRRFSRGRGRLPAAGSGRSQHGLPTRLPKIRTGHRSRMAVARTSAAARSLPHQVENRRHLPASTARPLGARRSSPPRRGPSVVPPGYGPIGTRPPNSCTFLRIVDMPAEAPSVIQFFRQLQSSARNSHGRGASAALGCEQRHRPVY